MKIKSGFTLHNVCGEHVIIAEGIENINFSKMINLNETAAYLWTKATESPDFSDTALITWLCDEYDVTTSQAETDVREMLKKWQELGLIED
jgi:hypothetical protein